MNKQTCKNKLSVIAGIDEAGLGPVLGPLVISCAAFEIPENKIGGDFWEMLRPAVARKSSAHSSAVVFADSKKIYSRQKKKPMERLERGVLSILSVMGYQPANLTELLDKLCPPAIEEMKTYPWYRGTKLPLPHHAGKTDITLAGNAIADAMKRECIRPLGIHSEPIFPERYNKTVIATNNKSTVLFDATCRLLYSLWPALPDGLSRIHIDRQGGRMRYIEGLMRVFPGRKIKIIIESPQSSEYRIFDGGKCVEISFSTGGESKHLSTALASMASKYLRELFMLLFNRFWVEHVEQIKPTAGYFTDGNRFFEQIKPAMLKMGIDKNKIYRQR